MRARTQLAEATKSSLLTAFLGKIGKFLRSFFYLAFFRQYVDEWVIPLAHLPKVLTRLRNTLKRNSAWAADFPVEVGLANKP